MADLGESYNPFFSLFHCPSLSLSLIFSLSSMERLICVFLACLLSLDLGTEHLRFLGDLRFTLGYIQGSISRRRYPCKLTVLVETSSKSQIAQNHNQSLLNLSSSHTRSEDEEGDEMPELKYGTPDQELSERAREELGRGRRLKSLPRDGELEGGDGGRWWEIDLMGEEPTSKGNKRKGKEKGGVFFLYGGKLPWISKDVRSLTLIFLSFSLTLD